MNKLISNGQLQYGVYIVGIPIILDIALFSYWYLYDFVAVALKSYSTGHSLFRVYWVTSSVMVVLIESLRRLRLLSAT